MLARVGEESMANVPDTRGTVLSTAPPKWISTVLELHNLWAINEERYLAKEVLLGCAHQQASRAGAEQRC